MKRQLNVSIDENTWFQIQTQVPKGEVSRLTQQLWDTYLHTKSSTPQDIVTLQAKTEQLKNEQISILAQLERAKRLHEEQLARADAQKEIDEKLQQCKTCKRPLNDKSVAHLQLCRGCFLTNPPRSQNKNVVREVKE